MTISQIEDRLPTKYHILHYLAAVIGLGKQSKEWSLYPQETIKHNHKRNLESYK